MTWIGSGVQTISVKAINNCGESEGSILNVNVVDFPTAVDPEDINTKEILVYPVPFDNFITISITASVQKIRIKVLDLSGKTLLMEEFSNTDDEIILESGFIPNGIYLLVTESEMGYIFRRLIIKN